MPCHKRQPKTLSKAQWILPCISAKSVNRSRAHTKINLSWRKAKVFISQVITLLRLTLNSSQPDYLVYLNGYTGPRLSLSGSLYVNQKLITGNQLTTVQVRVQQFSAI